MQLEVCGDKLDSKELRNVLGCFGTGVTVVTTLDKNGQKVGLTANSFSSVSLDPPIVLWSLSKQSKSLNAFMDASRFVINVLSMEQLTLSKQFSRPLEDRFIGVGTSEGIDGLPVLNDCAANIECRAVSSQEVGDHILFLGQIERYNYLKKETLLFCNGVYVKAVQV